MNLTTVETMRVYDALVRGRGTAKEAAIRAINNDAASLDREQLRTLTLQALVRDFPPPRAGQKDDLKSSDTRCWLLSAIGRLSDGDQLSAERVRKHLDRSWEPSDWARYWALEGLFAGKAPDLDEVAKRLTADESPLVSNLATAILASKGDVDSLALVEDKLNGDEREKWSMLRGLRIVPIAETGIVRQLCDFVENGGYSDVTFDAIVALGKLPVNSQVAESAAQTLSNYLIKYRWPMYDAMRTRALIALGNLKVERTSAVLIEELSDDSTAIVYEAGRALEKVIGVQTATARLLEAAIKGGPGSIQKFASALRSMNRTTVIEELESVLRSGSEAQQEIARTLMSEVGGMDAFRRLRARENAVNKYISVMEAAEAKVRKLFEDSIVEARQGFKLATKMDLTVFSIGILLIAGSAGKVLTSGGSLDNWAGVGLTGGTGVLGVLRNLDRQAPTPSKRISRPSYATQGSFPCVSSATPPNRSGVHQTFAGGHRISSH